VPRSMISTPAVMILLGWGVLAALFGIYDLPISVALAEPGSVWARFAERFGELPGLVMIIAALLVLGVASARPGDLRAAGRGLGLVFLATITTLYAVAVLLLGLGVDAGSLAAWSWPLWIFSLLVVSTTGVLLYRRSHPPGVRIRTIARQTLRLALFNVILFVQPAKAIWGRVRFRDLDPVRLAEFTPWFMPQGPTGHHSFPSGHTALGWMLLPLLLFIADRSRSVRIPALLLIMGWGLFVAFARVRIGAHYASDVLFPTALALLLWSGSSSSTGMSGGMSGEI